MQSLTFETVVEAVYSWPPEQRAGHFTCGNFAFNELRRLSDPSGRPLVERGALSGEEVTLLGLPLVVSSDFDCLSFHPRPPCPDPRDDFSVFVGRDG